MTTTEIETTLDVTTDLDSLDTSMDKIYAHHVIAKANGVGTMTEVMALPLIVAVCGYICKPHHRAPNDTPLLCPRCHAIGF